MKGLVIYRILTFIVNFFSALIAIELIPSILLLSSNPTLLIDICLKAGVVLYAWHANKFLRRVVLYEMPFTYRLRDWVLANAMVTLIYCGRGIYQSVQNLRNPDAIREAMEQLLTRDVTAEMVTGAQKVQIGLFSLWAIHVLWTCLLTHQYKTAIINPETIEEPGQDL